MRISHLFFSIILFIFTVQFNNSQAQGTGVINRTATIAGGRAILDPNGDGYTSATTSGFGTNDITGSEIPYKIVKSYSIEPYGDLRRGPDHKYSDFVPDTSDNGFYYYFTGTEMLFRFRLGSIMPGSKGYSILLDTDGKFGASGPNADPNYQPATTGVNGNPGFEIEIVMETNFRIAIYNVDGTSSPTLVKSYTNWQDMSQFSIAATNDNGDPDFFMDFYIPFSDLQAAPFNLTTSSSLRMIPTTVMSPQAAIGGPKSDIYGLNDAAFSNTNQQYEDFINGQPVFTLGGSGIGPMCTAAPVVNEPISTGTVNISGTWTKSGLSGAAATATITVYKNGVSAGTVSSVTSGATWTLNGVSVAGGDVITAKAQATGESMCLSSNAVTAASCDASNTSSTSGIAFVCFNSRRGFSGTRISNASVKIYSISSGGSPVLFATDGTTTSPSGFNITYSDATHWEYNGANNSGTIDPCSGGPNDIPNGSYFFTNTESGKCESAPVWGGCVNLSASTAPVITQTNLYAGTNSISGTATAGATVRLYKNGSLLSSTTATGGNYSFSNISMSINDVIEVFAQATGSCVSTAASRTVTCFTNTPMVNADGNNQLSAGAPITGTSGDGAGTTIYVYTSGAVLVATTSVQGNGTWSTGNAGTTPSAYNAVAGTSYYATAKNGSCAISTASATYAAATSTNSSRCGTITGPVASNAASISGTLTGSFTTTTVNLYLDDVLIGTTTTNNTSWGPITVNTTATNTLYPDGVLKIGVQESGKKEVTCTSSATTISCTPTPSSPTVTPALTAINTNQAVTYTISNAVSGTFYAIADSATGRALGQGKWATSNGNLVLTTDAFSSSGTYSINLKSTSLSGTSVCTSQASKVGVIVSGVLPVILKSFTGKNNTTNNLLEWKTENDYLVRSFEIQKSSDGNTFNTIATRNGLGGNGQSYLFTDAGITATKNYYRLKLVQQNGNTFYSSVIMLSAKMDNQLKARVSPNPFTGVISIDILLDKTQEISLSVSNVSGAILLNKTIGGVAGQNSFKLTDLAKLGSGIYQVRITTDSAVYVQKLVKIN